MTILIFIFIGILISRLRAFPKNTAQLLNLMVIWVALPATIFIQTPKLNLSSQMLIPALTPWFMILIFAALTYSVGKFLKWERKTLGALMLLVPLGNTSFLGIPVVQSFYGADAIPIAIIYDQVGSFLGLGVYGVIIISLFASGEELKWKKVFIKAFTFPPFVSLILAFLVSLSMKKFLWSYPDLISATLEILANTLVPMAMIAVGFQLTLKLTKKGYMALAYGLSCKLIIPPLLLILLFKSFGWGGETVQVTILESAMPPMITAGAISISSGLDEDLSASMVGIGLLLSLFTLPIMRGLISSSIF